MDGKERQIVGGRRARLRVRLAAILVAVLVALLVAEIAARVLYPVVHQVRHFEPGMFLADHERGWIPRPGYEGVYAEFLSETKVRVNSLGLRGPELDPGDRAADLRILCVGDSNTFGLGVAGPAAFPAQLGAVLGSSEGNCAVWNAGVVGYATLQEKLTLEKFAPLLEPNVVVLGWLRNDVGAIRSRPLVIDGYVSPSREEYERFRRSYAEPRFYEVSRLVTVLNLFVKFHRHSGDAARLVAKAQHERDQPEETERNVNLVLEMARYCQERRIRFLVLAYDNRAQVETGTAHPIVTNFIERMKAEGIETVSVGDLLRADFAAHGESLFVRRDDIHLNARGHRLVARVVADLLE